MYGVLPLDQAGLQGPARPAHMPLGTGHAFNGYPSPVRKYVQHLTPLAHIFSSHHLNGVALPNVRLADTPVDVVLSHLKHLRSQRDYLHVIPISQLPRDRSENTGPPRIALLIDDHDRILV